MNKQEKIKTNAVIYARFSSKMQNDGASIDLQLDACKDFAKKNGYTIVGNYVDEAISGTKEDQRIQFMQMITDAETHDFSTVLVYKYNRFARDMRLQLKYEDLLDQFDVSLIATTENYGDSHQANLLKMISAWSAENDIIQISENVLRGQKSRARECRHCGGLPPLGYDVDPTTKNLILSSNENEITAVKTIFDMRSQGYTYQEIVKALDYAGVNRSKKGQRITKTSMLSILKNEKYMGTFVFNKSTAKDKRGKRNGHRYKDDAEIIKVPNGCPAIVEEDTFLMAQEILKNPNASSGRARATRYYLLSGLLKCCCGAAYIAHYRNERPGHKGYANYVCSGRRRNPNCTCQNKGIEMTSLDTIVLSIVQDILLQDAQNLTDHLNSTRAKAYSNLDSQLKETRRQVTEVEKKIKNLSTAIADGFYDQTLQKQLQELIESKSLLLKKIDDLTTVSETPMVTVDLVKEKLSTISNFMQSNNIREVQMALSSLIDEITIHTDRVEIHLKIPINHVQTAVSGIDHTISRGMIADKQYDGGSSPLLPSPEETESFINTLGA